jgi:tetratricopeptide (TPR) repeat protein
MNRGRLVPLVLLIAGLLTLSGFSLAWSAEGASENPSADLRWVHPSRELRLIMQRLGQTRNDGVSEALDRANQALRKAPLEEEPFVLAALSAYNEDRFAEADALMDIARKRSPRSKEARFLAVDVNLALGDIPAAVENLEVLLRIAPDQATLLQDALVLVASHPEAGKAALGALQGDRTKAMVLAGLAQSGAGPSILLDAIRITGAAQALKEDPATIASLTRPFIDAGNFNAAFQIWSELVSKRQGRLSLLRDGQFEQNLPPPFGWEFYSGSFGYVAGQSPGLAGEVYGRQSALLARQLLLLPAGSYRIEVNVVEPSDLIETVLQCLPAEEIVRGRIERTGTQKTSFAVPADCRGQWLEVRARASDPPRADAFQIKSIRINEGGA